MYEVFLASVRGCVKSQRWRGRQVEGETGGGGDRWNRTAVHKFNFEWTSSAHQDLEQDRSMQTVAEP